MKKFTQKIPFIFIGIAILLSFISESLLAQKVKGVYFCRCGYRRYGCPLNQIGCVAYCATRCDLALQIPVVPNASRNLSTLKKFRKQLLPALIMYSITNDQLVFEKFDWFVKPTGDAIIQKNIHQLVWSNVD